MTTLEALDGEVKYVVEGGKGVRLIDERHAQSSASGCLNKVKGTPSAVVKILGFDSTDPGPGEKVTRRCPVPECKGKIIINKNKPAPGKHPSRLASVTA